MFGNPLFLITVISLFAFLSIMISDAHAATVTISDPHTSECQTHQKCFEPSTTTIDMGDLVVWQNPTEMAHSIIHGTHDSIGGMFDIGFINPGYSAGFTFHSPGVHQYFCQIHPWMTGVVHVTDKPLKNINYSPAYQHKSGIMPENITCKNDRYLAYKLSDASPICIKESSLVKLYDLGFAIPYDTSIVSERLESEKQRFIKILSEYFNQDLISGTRNLDDLHRYVELIDYKNDILDVFIQTNHMASRGSFSLEESGRIMEPEASIERMSPTESELYLSYLDVSDKQYSQTNIQVLGVDEPDFVKNDADSIYVIAQNDNIVLADVDGNGHILPSDIFPYIAGAKYLLLYQDILAILSDTGSTTITLLDISSGPKVISKLELGSHLYDARMINDTIYTITVSDVFDVPSLHDTINETYNDSNVYFFKDSIEADDLYTITAIPIHDPSLAESSSFVLGASDTVYVSENNIYFASAYNYPDVHALLFEDDFFFKSAINYLAPHELALLYVALDDNDIHDVADIILGSFEEKGALILVEELAKTDTSPFLDYQENTIIYKIAIDGTSIKHLTSGSVNGHLLDSFALDQKDEMLRVVTSSRNHGILQSNVYTLDKNLNVIGSLEDIAPHETLHSTRFAQDWLYIVTFRQVDPFFVIDVSGVQPKILGELKIPGYSEYLQNYDVNHVIGIGRDTNQNEFDETDDAGIKISMFDVTDFKNPREIQSVIIGDHSTDSAGLVEHKSLLIDNSKNIISIPVRFGGELFFYVYTVNDDYTIDVHSTIHHRYDESNPSHMRSLYIGDVLYTVTPKLIKANSLLEKDVAVDQLLLALQ